MSSLICAFIYLESIFNQYFGSFLNIGCAFSDVEKQVS